MGDTLEMLRARVREAADMVDNQYIDDDELERFINAGWRKLCLRLRLTHEDFSLASTDIALTPGVNDYSLAAVTPRPLKFRGVDFQTSSNAWIPLRRANWNERGDLMSTSGLTGTLRVWYIPVTPPLVDVSATPADPDVPEPEAGAPSDAIIEIPDYVDGAWTELVVLEAAIRCATKEEGMAGNLPDLKQLRDGCLADLSADAPDRDAEQPHQAILREDDDEPYRSGRAYRRSAVGIDLPGYLFQGMLVKLIPGGS